MSKKTAILIAKMRHLLEGTNGSIIIGSTLAFVLAYIQREVVALSVIMAWLSLIIIVAISRIAQVISYKCYPVEEHSDNLTRLMKFRLGTLISGLAWGSAGIFLFSENNPQHQMFLIFILAGLTVGGVIAYSADLLSSLLYSTSTLTPLAIRLFVSGDPISTSMGLSVIVYLAFMLFSVRNINKSVINNFELNYEAAAREEAVRVSAERYRLLFNNSPLPTWVIDATTLKFLDVNERAVEHYGYTREEFLNMSLRDIRPLEEMHELHRIISSINHGKIDRKSVV